MKQQLLILVFCAISMVCFSQKDTSKKAVTYDTLCIIPKAQFMQLIQDIEVQLSHKYEVKDEQWLRDHEMIINNIKLIPNK